MANYPKIFNVVITKKAAKFLELDFNNPYVEFIEVKKNKTFIAKEGVIFEEEKNVAAKLPRRLGNGQLNSCGCLVKFDGVSIMLAQRLDLRNDASV